MKIKFILNYKFEELKQQVEPREIKLREMQVQLSGQDDALNDQLKEMDYMKNSIQDREAKMKGMDGELGRLRSLLADRNSMLSQILHNLALSIEDNRGKGPGAGYHVRWEKELRADRCKGDERRGSRR